MSGIQFFPLLLSVMCDLRVHQDNSDTWVSAAAHCIFWKVSCQQNEAYDPGSSPAVSAASAVPGVSRKATERCAFHQDCAATAVCL